MMQMAGDKPLQPRERQVLRKSFPRWLAGRSNRSSPEGRPGVVTVVIGEGVVVCAACGASSPMASMTSVAATSAVSAGLRRPEGHQREHDYLCR